jgi:hypothetical protein
MDIAVTKLEILDWVMHLSNGPVLEKLIALKAETSGNDDIIVGYTVLGEPLNSDAYMAHVNEGLQDIKNGRVTSHDDFLDEVKSW